jgi:hypothetical protein
MTRGQARRASTLSGSERPNRRPTRMESHILTSTSDFSLDFDNPFSEVDKAPAPPPSGIQPKLDGPYRVILKEVRAGTTDHG